MRAILLCLLLAGCAVTPAREPDPPRLRCINMGVVPSSAWFVYLCSFTGEEAPPVLERTPDYLGGS